MVLRRWETITGKFGFINWVDNVNWPLQRVSKLTFRALALRQSEWNSLRSIYVINPVDNTKLSFSVTTFVAYSFLLEQQCKTESKTRVLVFIILFLKIHRISLEITKLLIERSCSSVRIIDEIPVFLPSSYSTSQLYQCYTVMSSARNLL